MPASQSPTVGLSTLVHHLARRLATVTGSVISGSVSEGSQSVPCLLPSALPASLTNPFTPAATGDDPKSPTRSRAALGCTAGFGAIAPRSYFVVECTKIAVSLSVLRIRALTAPHQDSKITPRHSTSTSSTGEGGEGILLSTERKSASPDR